MKQNKINILIPAAGLGLRFNSNIPKPLIDVCGEYMLTRVLNNFSQGLGVHFYVCILSEHEEKFNISDRIKSEVDYPITFIKIDKLQDGPAKTCYMAKEYIHPDSRLIITNCDQYILDLDIFQLDEYIKRYKADGLIGTFYSNSNKNSYIKLDDNGYVVDVKEKAVISNYATNGLHYWNKSSYFFDSCDEMFKNNDKVFNEFYVAPTYNYMLKNSKKVVQYFFNEHYPIGTPEDLEKFKKIYENL